MIYLSAKDLNDAIKLREDNPSYYLLFGASDLAIKIKKGVVYGIIDISHLEELSYIDKNLDFIEIGALTTINTILKDGDVNQHLKILGEACKSFASHQIRNIASIGGNIANDSPVADLIAPLLVLNTKVTLLSVGGERTILLEELFNGYKSLNLHNEIIKSFIIPLTKHQYYYRKVGAREKLNITKVSLAVVKNKDSFFISGASLNPYVSRFSNLEKLLNCGDFSDEMILLALENDTSPSGSFRSTKEYRIKVLFNMLKEAIGSFKL